MSSKPESVPTVTEREHPARWMEKVRQLAIISLNIYKELGEIVLEGITIFPETWMTLLL